MSQLRSVTCHMGSHSVTCYPTQVNALRLHPGQSGPYSIYLPRRDGRLSAMNIFLWKSNWCEQSILRWIKWVLCYALADDMLGLNVEWSTRRSERSERTRDVARYIAQSYLMSDCPTHQSDRPYCNYMYIQAPYRQLSSFRSLRACIRRIATRYKHTTSAVII